MFNYHPQWALQGGVARMADWAKKLGPCQPTTFKNIEVEKFLPPSWKV
jgi:hypothetical protein